MANIQALISTPSNVHLFAETRNKFIWYDHGDGSGRRRSSGDKYKCLNSYSFGGSAARVSDIDHSWRLFTAVQIPVIQESFTKDTNGHNQMPLVEIPVTGYQIIGLNDQAEKDEIVKSVMHLKNAEIEEGYTKDTMISRQDLLIDVRDKLLFEPEYAGNVKDMKPPKSSLKITWNWLPGALCLLQEVGEDKLVLEIGRKVLLRPESKPFMHDLLLSMALAECVIAKVGFEKNNISQGFEALARAQCLLRSKLSLGKMTLLSQIEESLEELAPACTLDLLGMPRSPENAERRLGAIAAMRELLRQGLDVEASCKVQDWAGFLSQALRKLIATEIVELIPWDSLALTRKNRKSLESQNQRIIIDFNSFYYVLLAHIAHGFSSKQPDLIGKAKLICECLMASEGIDLKFEEAFCSFLLGQGDEETAVERLRQLQQSSSTSSLNLLRTKESREVPSASKQLESWLKEAVLASFPDTRDCSSSLADFFNREKRAFENRQNKKAPPTVSNLRHRPIAIPPAPDQRDNQPVSSVESSRHLGPAVKQLAPPNLQNPLIEVKDMGGSNIPLPSIQIKRSLGPKHQAWKICLGFTHMLGKMMVATAVGCILVVLFKLADHWRYGNAARLRMYDRRLGTFSPTWNELNSKGAAGMQNVFMSKLKRAFSVFRMESRNRQESSDLRSASLSSGLSTSVVSTYRQPMSVEDAEALVKQWQGIKSKALGPDHDIPVLGEILDGSMLVHWQTLANAAKSRSCFWRFVLLQLSIRHAEIMRDETGRKIAEIEVLLEEAAELVDESQPKNPTYYSPYRIRYLLKSQEDGSWKFCECDILTPS